MSKNNFWTNLSNIFDILRSKGVSINDTPSLTKKENITPTKVEPPKFNLSLEPRFIIDNEDES